MEDRSGHADKLFLIFCNLLLGVIFLSAFIANILVLVVFYKKRGLRNTANRFVVNLMIINLLSCISLLPLSLADNSVSSADKVLCIATELCSVFCSSVTVYAVFLIALDQYCAVVDPLHYHRLISNFKSNLMIISSWCLSAAFAVADGIQPTIDNGEYSVFRHCGLRSDTQKQLFTNETAEFFVKAPSTKVKIYRYVFCSIFAISVFAIPFVLICFIYYRICAAASRNTKRTRTGCSSSDDSTHSVGGKCDSHVSDKPDYFLIANELKKRDNAPGQHLETCGLLMQEKDRPSFIVTRPSPPRSRSDHSDAEETTPVPRTDTLFLKPTLKNNPSFGKLSPLHIQFSGDTSGDVRDQNQPAAVLDADIGKAPSILSSVSEARSTSRTSRSSSINSGSARNPASRTSSIRSTSSYIVHNIRHRISNASLFRYREEARAARISALVIVMALVCWLPFFTVFYLHSGIQLEVISGRRSFPLYFDSFSIAFLLLSAVVSPFLFAFRNKKIKKEIQKIVKFRVNDVGSECARSFYKYNLGINSKSQNPEFTLGKEDSL